MMIPIAPTTSTKVMEHIVFLERNSVKAQFRQPEFEHTYAEYPITSAQEVVQRLQDATIAIVNKVPVRADALAQLPKLRMIAMAATGYDCVDIAECRKRGIAVANIRNYAVHTVPEHVFALILALRRNIIAYRQDVLNGVWQKSEQFCFITHEIGDLFGATIGIVGAGALAQGVASIARGFGMKVLFAGHESSKPRDFPLVSFDEVLKHSDIITLHCTLNDKTRDLISTAQLQQMKRSAILINTARGGLVNEQALIQALDEGLIAGAGFDVITTEPPRNGHPLLNVNRPNFILTPHVAWASAHAMQFLADQLIDNLELWKKGTPQHIVT